jgi:hypothetical protein
MISDSGTAGMGCFGAGGRNSKVVIGSTVSGVVVPAGAAWADGGSSPRRRGQQAAHVRTNRNRNCFMDGVVRLKGKLLSRLDYKNIRSCQEVFWNIFGGCRFLVKFDAPFLIENGEFQLAVPARLVTNATRMFS